MTNVGSSIFYTTPENEELQPASVRANTTDTLCESQADAAMSGKPGLAPKRPIPLPRGAVIPKSPSSSPHQTRRELPRPPVSPRKPSEVNGSSASLGGDWKYMTLPTKGSPSWKRPRTASDDTYLNRGKGNGRPPLPRKPNVSHAGKAVCVSEKSLNSADKPTVSVTGKPAIPPISVTKTPVSVIGKPASSPVSVTGPVIPPVSVTDKPVSPVTRKLPISDKLSTSVPSKPVVPLKPPHIVNATPSLPAPYTKPGERSCVELDGNVKAPLRPGRKQSGSTRTSSDSNSGARERGSSDSEVPSAACDRSQPTQTRPIPPPRVKQKLGTDCTLSGSSQDKQKKTEDPQGQVGVIALVMP